MRMDVRPHLPEQENIILRLNDSHNTYIVKFRLFSGHIWDVAVQGAVVLLLKRQTGCMVRRTRGLWKI